MLCTSLLLGGCSLLGGVNTEPTPAMLAARQSASLQALLLRMQYGNWLLGSRPQQRDQERQRLRGQSDLDNRLNLAMVNSHPDEPVARRKAALDTIENLLPEASLDEQAYLRSWLSLSHAQLEASPATAEVRRLQARIRDLEAKIAKLTVIDDQINQRSQPGPSQPGT